MAKSKSKIQSTIDAATALASHAVACALGASVTLEHMDGALSATGLTVDTLAGAGEVEALSRRTPRCES